jgi:hypothetical protein
VFRIAKSAITKLEEGKLRLEIRGIEFETQQRGSAVSDELHVKEDEDWEQ